MHPLEEATIRAFIQPGQRTRWLESLASPKRRPKALDRLNHCRDFDERYIRPLDSRVDVLAALLVCGAPPTCHVLSDSPDLDGCELPLAEAVAAVEASDWSSLICCVPGKLAYYRGECGERRLLLEQELD